MNDLDQRLHHLVTTIANSSPTPPTLRDIPLARRSPTGRGPLVAVFTFAMVVLVFGVARWMLSLSDPVSGEPTGPMVTVRHQVIEFTISAELSCDQAVGAGTSTLRLETWADFGGGRFRQLATYPDGSTRDRIALGDPVNPDRSYGKGEPRLVSPRCGIDLLGGDPTDGPDIAFYDPPVRQPGSVGYQELGTLLAGTHRDSRDRPALLYRWVLNGGYGVSDDGTEYPIHQETEWYVDEATGHVLETTFRQTSELRYDVTHTTVIVSDEEIQVDPALFSTDGFELEWDATTATTVASSVTTAVGAIPPESIAALAELDDIESRATAFLDRAYLLERAWESRQITYADAQQTLTVLATDVAAWSAEVASQSNIPVDMQPAFAVVVVEVANLTDGVGAISEGLAAPDDGTLRRDALTAFAAGVVRVFQAVDAARGTLGASRSDTDPYYSMSLEAVSVLPPFRWPWFADGVSTPPDALAAASDLVDLMTQVPALVDIKVLAAERPYGDPDPALQIRWAWLKVTDTELLRIGTQLITSDTAIPQEGTIVTLPNGWSDVRTKTGAIITKLVIGDRLVLVDLTSTQGSEVLSLTADDLLAIAASIIALA
jgi:hypothetical protein